MRVKKNEKGVDLGTFSHLLKDDYYLDNAFWLLSEQLIHYFYSEWEEEK